MLSPDLRGEDAVRQRYGSQQETVDLTEDRWLYRRQHEVQTSLHVDASKHTWNT